LSPVLRSARLRVVTATFLVVAAAAFAVAGGRRAYADATAPPPYPSNCPPASNPPPNYPTTSPPIPYEVPFRAIIFDGRISLPPNVVIPHLYATACGLVRLPQLTGTIAASNIVLAPPNVYISGLEAIPAKVSFGQLTATIDLTPAHNGGLDITVSGSTQASVTTLGMTCGITLQATFTTRSDGVLTGQPVTGPTQQGQAEVVSNSFSVPAIVGSDSGTCPPSIAQTFNQLVGLPARPGVGQFTAPFCFDFELENTNLPPRTASCPWPS
jgi:hypothetical protein